jgi:hypothetical protein
LMVLVKMMVAALIIGDGDKDEHFRKIMNG